jgi:hypothetical protein
MSGRVLVIGAQGVLGTFIARALRNEGWEVTRGGRRPEAAPDFRLVDLDQPETIRGACREVDVVVSTVRDARLVAERAVLRDGGILINLDDLPAAERAALKGEVTTPQGLVVDRSGLAGVAVLAGAELLDQCPEADTVELCLTLSALAPSGRAGRAFAHRLLEQPEHHATAMIELPPPFGRRRCIEAGSNPATESLVREVVGPRTAHLYICFSPRVFGGVLLALNHFRLLSRLPRAVFTSGRRRVPAKLTREPVCCWACLRRGDELLATGFVRAEGDYRGTVAATLVFAAALLPPPGGAPLRRGVFGVEEVLTLRQLEPALAEHGITVTRQREPTGKEVRQ